MVERKKNTGAMKNEPGEARAGELGVRKTLPLSQSTPRSSPSLARFYFFPQSESLEQATDVASQFQVICRV